MIFASRSRNGKITCILLLKIGRHRWTPYPFTKQLDPDVKDFSCRREDLHRSLVVPALAATVQYAGLLKV